jgi:hypothetical protein
VSPATPDELAARLQTAGYRGLFQLGSDTALAAAWGGGANRTDLRDIVGDVRRDGIARVLAAEVLFALDDEWPRASDAEAVAAAYTEALAATGEGQQRGLTGNAWGVPSVDGPLATHLLAAGPAAVPHLRALLDDGSPVLYEGSQEATIAAERGVRVKDIAASLLARTLGVSFDAGATPAERDREIERLSAAASR